MLEDYKRYLTNVRNNLIQCGVEFPITPLDDYRDLFRLGLQLDGVLWYYSILAISGSENALKGYFLPLSSYYKEQMRQRFYKEFLEYLPDYRKLSLMNNLLGNVEGVELGTVAPKSTIQDDEVIDLFEKPEELSPNILQPESECGKLSEMVEVPFIMPEVTGNILPSEPELPLPVSNEFDDEEMVDEFNEEDVVHGVYLDLDLEEPYEECVSGVDLDSEELVDNDSESETVHGIYIDELEDEDVEEVKGGIDLDEEDSSEEEVVHGIYIDELEEEDSWQEEESNDFYEVDEDEDLPFTIEYEDDFSKSQVEETEEILFFEENGVQYSNHGRYVEDYNENENSGYDEDMDYVSTLSEYVSDEDSDDLYDENGHLVVSEDNSDDEDYVVPDVEWSTDEDFSTEVLKPNIEPTKPKEVVQEKDVSDLLQDWTNSLLTKGKKSLLGSLSKLKDD